MFIDYDSPVHRYMVNYTQCYLSAIISIDKTGLHMPEREDSLMTAVHLSHSVDRQRHLDQCQTRRRERDDGQRTSHPAP